MSATEPTSTSESKSASASTPSTFKFSSLTKCPSHILSDGSHVYLPPPSAFERGSFFERTVIKHDLIRADEDDKNKDKHKDKDKEDDNDKKDADKDADKDDDKDDDKDMDMQTIHPLAVASARLQTNGISELHKAINLSNLVQSGEYFAFANIIEAQHAGHPSQSSGIIAKPDATNAGGANSKSTSTSNPSTGAPLVPPSSSLLTSTQSLSPSPDTIEHEQSLRSTFVLTRKRHQYTSASQTFRRHAKRLRVVTTTQKVLDERYLELRRRWRLSAPEHGNVVIMPVRPDETIAVDVDIYRGRGNGGDNGEQYDGGSGEGGGGGGGTLGKIARMIPRYATIELSDGFDIHSVLDLDLDSKKDDDEGDNVNMNMVSNVDVDVEMKLKRQESSALTDDSMNMNTDVDVHKSEEIKATANGTSPSTMEINSSGAQPINGKAKTNKTAATTTITDADAPNTAKTNTVAQPFAIADPRLGSIDLERFDPEKVPMLTLVFQIEKPSTGFVHSVALSSSIECDDEHEHENNDEGNANDGRENGKEGNQEEKEMKKVINSIIRDKVKPNADEQVIQSLQHSLFCANVFDSIRNEIATHSHNRSMASGMNGHGNRDRNRNWNWNRTNASTPQDHAQNQNQQQPVWLSSEMEYNFIPPPSLMAGGRMLHSSSQGSGSCPLAVIHCHEGEVKVQLDSEYSLVVKLVDVKNHSDAGGGVGVSDNGPATDTTASPANGHGNGRAKGSGDSDTDTDRDSGSQSREQLHVLCKLLQLHAQFIFHDHNKRNGKRQRRGEGDEEDDEDADGVDSETKRIDYSAGMASSRGGGGGMSGGSSSSMVAARNRNQLLPRRKAAMDSPNILQSCVALGTKILLERQMRDLLQHLAIWQKQNIPSLIFVVEWLALSTFDLHSRFAMSFDETHSMDVNITGSTMTVTSSTDDGDYRVLNLESSEEFELFAKNEMRRLGKRARM